MTFARFLLLAICCFVLFHCVSKTTKPSTQAVEYVPRYDTAWSAVEQHVWGHWAESKSERSDVPYPYVATEPGDSVIFYWDNYFSNLGLLLNDTLKIYARYMTDNLLYEVEQFGYVPNANEPWGMNRSQIPYLSLMVMDVYNQMLSGDTAWLYQTYQTLKKEYHFWTDDRASAIEDHTTSIEGLQRFYHHGTDDELAKMYDQVLVPRFRAPKEVSREQKIQAIIPYIAEAEVMDFTPRFEGRCPDFVAVDLNTNLYLYERNFARIVRELALEGEPDWSHIARQRQQRIQRYCWNEERGLFMDYDFVNEGFSKVASIATFYPLFAGLATEEQAQRIVEQLDLFEYDYGITICEPSQQEHVYQWDYPAGWPPMFALVVQALDRYGFEADARRIAAKYLDVVTKNFIEPLPDTYYGNKKRSPGSVYEKYNVVDGSLYDAEYYSHVFQGWSFGVFVYLLDYYRDDE